MGAKLKVYDIATQQVITQSGEPVQTTDFRKYDKNAWLKGWKHSPVAGATSEFNQKFDKDVWIWGGSYHVSGSHVDDYIEFEVVDIDNVLGFGVGVVLDRYVESEPVVDGYRFDMRMEDGAYIMIGLYLRIRYVSFGQQSPVLKGRYYLRRR
ncbi:hypothetical protein [Methylobacter sp.]|uniref:hypothetical protein n=1 Tax=Methylobacter sp. TaxID=2051955 RepID=UPI0012252D4F|nr:hypothetical protein [Methylobacter sp.]TAK59553.1 MAG: hypothetical protein EPO18_20540 [Methylobacter sp.]